MPLCVHLLQPDRPLGGAPELPPAQVAGPATLVCVRSASVRTDGWAWPGAGTAFPWQTGPCRVAGGQLRWGGRLSWAPWTELGPVPSAFGTNVPGDKQWLCPGPAAPGAACEGR